MPPETPPWRVKNPCRTPGSAARPDTQSFILSGVTMEREIGSSNVSEGRRRGKPARLQREDLEQNPHLTRIGEPGRARQDRRLLCRCRILPEPLTAGLEPELEQEFALRHRSIGGKPKLMRGRC